MLDRLQHELDRLWRRYRWYLRPLIYRRYRRWLARQNREAPAHQPVAVFDFRDSRIDGPQGRRFYTLFMFFVRTGYYPMLARSYLFLANIGKKEKRHTLSEDFAILEPGGAPPADYVLITDRATSRWARGASRIIRIDYRPEYQPGDGTFPMPFPLFPGVYARGEDQHIHALRRHPRPWRVFFGGDALLGKYSQPSITRVYRKLPRTDVLERLRQALPASCWVDPQNQAEFDALRGASFDGLVIMNTRNCRVPVQDWLATVASGRFYLACPGYRYPMSHNIIEAMAVGSIPITQYPELFFPTLEHGKNCLVFRGAEDLADVVQQAIDMPEAEADRLAAGAAAYYDQFLSPQATVSGLLAMPGREVRLRLVPFIQRGGGYA